MTLSPPCFTVGSMQLSWLVSPARRHTRRISYEPDNLIFVLSDHRIFDQKFHTLSLYALAKERRLDLCLALRRGFFRGTRPWCSLLIRLRRTVRAETVLPETEKKTFWANKEALRRLLFVTHCWICRASRFIKSERRPERYASPHKYSWTSEPFWQLYWRWYGSFR